MTITVQYLLSELEAMERSLSLKGCYRPSVYAQINLTDSSFMSIYAQYRPDPNSWETVDTRVHLERYEKDALTDESLDTALREIQEWVTNVKPEEERKREEFLASLGRLIDRGRSIGIEVDFLNPLVESMRQLSENILTDQR